jgi:hypothetical protein
MPFFFSWHSALAWKASAGELQYDASGLGNNDVES